MKLKYKLSLSICAMLVITFVILGLVFTYGVSKVVSSSIEKELVNYSNLGLALMDAQYPGDWHEEDGKLFKGSEEIVQDFASVDNLKDATNMVATVFLRDTRVATSILDSTGKRIVGTKAKAVVVEKVIKNGEKYLGEVEINGEFYDTYYVPLKDADGKNIGMWFVGVSNKVIDQKVFSSYRIIAIIMLAVLALGFIYTMLTSGVLAKTMKGLVTDIDVIALGDFTGEVNSKYLKRKDELGDIAKAVEKMKHSVRGIILDSIKEMNTIESTIDKTVTEVTKLHSDIEDISATTEELAAGMEETAAGTEEMSATSHEIETIVDGVANRANEGMSAARDIKTRAEKLKADAFESQRSANEVYSRTQVSLRSSIEKSKSVDKIRGLTDAILSISSQTNLLALNAAIEAARAGESGKGFAVVADEIRKLAEDSSKAVSQIQTVVEDVMDSVTKLVKDSQEILQFVDSQVIKDYEAQVIIGEQYSADADFVNGLMTDFTEKSQHLHISIQNILKAIDEITTASNEGAAGAVNIAEKAEDIVNKANEVVMQAELTKKSSERLVEEVSEFKV